MLNVNDQVQMQKALAFLKGKVPDHTGVRVEDYFSMNDAELESCHGWIQWAFPINTSSPYNDQCGNFYSSDSLTRQYKYGSPLYCTQDKLLDLYLNSIGLSRIESTIHTKFFQVVDSPYNHHMKRISRVLKHLMLTNRGRTAKKLYFDLMELVMLDPHNFTQKTLAFWGAIMLGYDDDLRDKL